MTYEQFHTSKDWERIDEGKIQDISKNILNKSRELGPKTKEFMKKAIKMGKREARQTAMALDIISQKVLKGRKISEEEKKFLKEQAKDIIRLLPLIAIQGIPAPVPITPFLIAIGRKNGFDILPKDQKEPDAFKDKEYNPVKAYKNRKNSLKENINNIEFFKPILNINNNMNNHEVNLENVHNYLSDHMSIDYQIRFLNNIEEFLLKNTPIYEKIIKGFDQWHDKCYIKIYDLEGKIAYIKIVATPNHPSLKIVWCDEKFKNSNFVRSLKGIDNYNL